MPTDSLTGEKNERARDRRARRALFAAILSVGAWLLADFPYEDVAAPNWDEMVLMAIFVSGVLLFVFNMLNDASRNAENSTPR